ncbi:MFS transporter [Bifidobacterium tsurumiense]|uniref:Permeases of the major facilitator superfamily n=1 Tax=Bifidobacterium tsurumiense TaxID=356829 RepID=A0A087ECI6_9BIFI|nr:MFS transporter [Bifidobacterium tsurumiense]KFJ05487.1 Permeases of the major facilitator superfamily [Bifidobacterium tsurumiense]
MVLAIVLIGYLIILLDTAIVVTGLPAIGAELGLTALHLSWVQNSYTLIFGSFLLLGARAGDIFGRRRVLNAGIALFTLASLAIGLSPNAAWLIAARIVQGAGAAILAPTTLALITEYFPEGEPRVRATSAYGIVAGIGAAAGMVLGGVFTSLWSWRVGFFINVPIGIALYFMARSVLPVSRTRSGQLDVLGAVLSVLGVGGILFAVVMSPEFGISNPLVSGSFVVGLLLIGVFVAHENRVPQPLMPLKLFRSPTRSGAVVTRFLLVGATFSFFFFTTQVMQEVLGMSALEAGLGFLPLSVTQFFVALGIPSLIRRGVSERILVFAGVAVMVIGMGWLAFVATGYGYWLSIGIPMALLGVGQGICWGPLNSAGIADTSPSEAGAASGIVNSFHQIGGTLGVGAYSALAVAVMGSSQSVNAIVGRAQIGQAVAAFALLVAAIVALAFIGKPQKSTYKQPNPDSIAEEISFAQ